MSLIVDKESKANLLRGYFSGDGSIYPAERGKFKIEAGTVSKELANDLLYLLLDFGIVATLYKKQERTGSTTHRISILGVRNFERFKDIGFIDSLRNSRIVKYTESRNWARSELIPLSGELYELASQQSSVYATNKSIGKEALRNMLILVDKDKSKYKEYWDLADGDIYFDLVKEIKQIPDEKYVYDVSVPGEQNFVGGFGGIIAHNSEKGVKKVFERARQVAPCVIFFDELDALAGRRGVEFGTRVTERVLNQLLAEMDGLEGLNDVTVIGATNRPDMLDPALLRPGRFDRIALIDVPDKAGRKHIFEIHTRNVPLHKDVDIAHFVELTDGFVGADIENFVREAAMLSLRRDPKAGFVTMKDFEDALKRSKPSVSDETAKRYKKIEDLYLKAAKSGVDIGPVYTG